MEPLGDYLKEVRESRNISIDKITKETHILKKFIYAIEKDEFSVFPGEAYLKGFLRNYSDYLGLEAQDIIKRYETIKLAEAPTPIEQLIPKPKPNFLPLIIVGIIAGIAGLGSLIFFIAKNIKERPPVVREQIKEIERGGAGESYYFTGQEALFNLKKDDRIIVTINGKEHFISAKEVESVVMIVDSNENELYLRKGTPERLDLNGDQVKDIEVIHNSWGKKSAELTVKVVVKEEIVAELSDNIAAEASETIHSTAKKGNIAFTISVNANTYLKYVVDDKDEVVNYYNKSSEIKISGKDRVIVAMSNGGAVSFNFDTLDKKITPAQAGKVDVKMFHWTKSNSGDYQLKMSSLK